MTQARELLEPHFRDVAKCLQANSEGKVAMTFDVLRADTEGMIRIGIQKVFHEFMGAITFSKQAKSIVELARVLATPLPVNDPMKEFVGYVDSSSEIAPILSVYRDLSLRYLSALTIMDRFPEVLKNWIVNGKSELGLIQLLRQYSDLRHLNRAVDRLIQTADPQQRELILALQEARTALDPPDAELSRL